MIRVLQGSLEMAEMVDIQDGELKANFWRRIMAKWPADVQQEDQ